MADSEESKSKFVEFLGYHWRGILTVALPLIFLPIAFVQIKVEWSCLYVVVLMTSFWITEAVPLYITSLIPIVLFPPLGVLDSETVCEQYFKDTLAMFVTGIMVALSIEYCNLHRRIALRTILIVGCTPHRILLGLVSASWFISLWISNSATTAMMCPIIKAVLEELQPTGFLDMYRPLDPELERKGIPQPRYPSRIATCFYLGPAFAATIGGCGTLIGTGTNLTLKGLYEGRFPNSVEQLGFPQFMMYWLPAMFLLLCVTYVWLCFMFLGTFRPNSKDAQISAISPAAVDIVRKAMEKKVAEVGTITLHEIQTLLLFVMAIVLLFFRSPGFMDGWGKMIPVKVKASLPMTLCVVMLFMFPIHYMCLRYFRTNGPFTKKPTPSLLSWPFLNSATPWGLLFLLGGGFAMSEGCIKSGAAAMLGNALEGLKVVPLPVIQLLSILSGVFMTQFCANVPACNIVIPILAEMALAVKVHPMYLLFPAGIGCSMAWLLPISTPPNAIISGYANVRTADMAIAGIGPLIFAVAIVFLFGQTWGYVVYPNSGTFPEWAKES